MSLKDFPSFGSGVATVKTHQECIIIKETSVVQPDSSARSGIYLVYKSSNGPCEVCREHRFFTCTHIVEECHPW